MKLPHLLFTALCLSRCSLAGPVPEPLEERQAPPPKGNKHLRPVLEKRQRFEQGQPISADGKGGPILGMNEPPTRESHKWAKWLTWRKGGTNKQLDLQNPDNLGAQSRDNGVVTNLKWSFSDSKTRLLNGGWVRTQVVTDLPASRDIASAQQHLKKGAVRELHWHRVVRRSCFPAPPDLL